MLHENVTLIIQNIGQLATLRSHTSGPRCGKEQSELGIIPSGAVAISGGLIRMAGRQKDLYQQVKRDVKTRIIDAGGKLVTPGLVDSHTHLVFAGDRSQEFEQRIKGKSYEQIAKAGGGIESSVRSLRQANEKELFESSWKKLDRMLEFGTTTVEIKSGYGLSLRDEVKTLKVVRELRRKYPRASVVATFMGAHAFPQEHKSSRKKYIDLIIKKMIPEIAELGLAEFCDIFCERGYFTPAESKSILETGKKFGLKPKIHAEEFGNYGGAKVAAEVGAVSADHLMHASLGDISRMKKAGVVAVLLPGTSFFLNSKRYSPARQMIQKNLPVALATDFNPGSNMSESMQMVMTLACLKLNMSPAETLTASTINAAYALDRGGQIGSIEPDKKADLVIWEVEDYRQIPYHYGVNLVKMVVKDGDVVYEKNN